jgi:hypothetical protein
MCLDRQPPSLQGVSKTWVMCLACKAWVGAGWGAAQLPDGPCDAASKESARATRHNLRAPVSVPVQPSVKHSAPPSGPLDSWSASFTSPAAAPRASHALPEPCGHFTSAEEALYASPHH